MYRKKKSIITIFILTSCLTYLTDYQQCNFFWSTDNVNLMKKNKWIKEAVMTSFSSFFNFVSHVSRYHLQFFLFNKKFNCSILII